MWRTALGPDELAWISNEYNICWCDDRYWLESYAYINADGTSAAIRAASFSRRC